MTPRAAAALLFAAVVAASFASSPSQAQHLAVYATNMPFGGLDLEFDSAGNMFVTAGNGAGRIYKVPPGGGAASVLVSTGLFYPWCLAFDPGGTLYVVDRQDGVNPSSGRILKVSPTGALTVFKSGLPSPFGITFDPSGNAYVGLYTSNKVVKITPAGVMSDYATGVGVTTQELFQISFDEAGNMYAGVQTDMYKIGPGGTPVTKLIAGGLLEALGHVRWAGDNFIVSTYGHRQLLHVSPARGVEAITSTAIALCTDGEMPNAASVGTPTGMRLRQGKVYVADSQCHNVRAFDVDGVTPVESHTWGQLKAHYR